MRFIKQKGKAHIEKNRVKNNPNIKNSMESIPQRIQSASLTVISQSMPSRLSSKIRPKGDLNERQKKKKKSATTPSQIIVEVIVNAPTISKIVPKRPSGDGLAK